MTSHSPRPLDSFLKKLPELQQQAELEWNLRERLELQSQQHLPLEPWQKQVLSTHPAFRNLRRDHPSFLRLTHQSQIRSRSLWSRLLRRLRIR